MTEKEIKQDYVRMLIDEQNEREAKIKDVLLKVKSIVNTKVYESIIEWVEDEENGIWGDLEIVNSPKGEYQEEYVDDCYWKTLKGMWVDQYVGICGDDFSGYLSVKLCENKYLQASFKL